MTPEQKAELEAQRKALLEEQRKMDMALAAAKNMGPGETIIESVLDQESMSDGEFDEEFDT